MRFAQYSQHSFKLRGELSSHHGALKDTEITGNREVCDVANQYLKGIRNECFVATLCGVIDIYNAIAKGSCRLQKVDVLPLESFHNAGKWRQRAQTYEPRVGRTRYCHLQNESQYNVEAYASWPTFSRNIDEISEGKFKGISAIEEERRALQSAADEGDMTNFIAVHT